MTTAKENIEYRLHWENEKVPCLFPRYIKYSPVSLMKSPDFNALLMNVRTLFSGACDFMCRLTQKLLDMDA